MSLTDLSLFLLLGPLVGVLLYLRYENRSTQFLLWTSGWILIAVHIGVLCLTRGYLPYSLTLASYHLATHCVSALLFMLSFSMVVNSQRNLLRTLLLLGVPAVCYASFLGFNLHYRLLFLIPTLVFFSGAIIIHWRLNPVRRQSNWMIVLGLLLVAITFQRIYIGDARGGFNTILAAICIVTSLMLVRGYKRLTPGPIVTAFGFFLWAVGWVVLGFVPGVSPLTDANASLWNVPKILTAMGMILLELENRSMAAREAERREHEAGMQIRDFADLTRVLLGGAEIRAIGPRIAEAIAASGDFERAAILLASPRGHFNLAGCAGLSPEEQHLLNSQLDDLSAHHLEELIVSGFLVGNIAAISYDPGRPSLSSISKETTLVPLRLHLGDLAGCILLESSAAPASFNSRGLAAIELLASDIAVALEKDSMQRKVLIHEKQASLGQLVNGVAHELNNPLTVLLGYCDLLGTEPAASTFRKEISTMRSEAMRMKSIIDNLLLFSRQTRTQTRFADIRHAVDEALALRGFDLKRAGADLNLVIDDDLPRVVIDEANLKTVLVQLLDNACDAVRESTPRIITITAKLKGSRIRLTVADTGPGFADLSRVFDPFFSTKGLGKGTGLGMSICYGIIKQHGGEISARNLEPQGAAVIVELQTSPSPVRTKESANPHLV